MILSRRQHFFILEKILLPLLALPLRLLVKSWRWPGPDPAILQRIHESPRVVLATFHGMLLQLLVLRPYLRREIFVMLSPSYDGRLLAAILSHFNINHVFGSSRSRNVAGPLELIRRMKGGDIGLVAVDGPRGPRGIAKPGFLKLARAADAHLLLVTTAARRGITFKTWDRAHLPAPFAAIKMSLQLLPPPSKADLDQTMSAVRTSLQTSAREIGSAVVKGEDT